jgi:hypothetical protein
MGGSFLHRQNSSKGGGELYGGKGSSFKSGQNQEWRDREAAEGEEPLQSNVQWFCLSNLVLSRPADPSVLSHADSPWSACLIMSHAVPL